MPIDARPLADKLRPTDFDHIVGQSHLFGKNGTVRKLCGAGHISNMVFYGPPGTGKTTAASIVAKMSGMQLYKLNATSATISDVKEVIEKTNSLFNTEGILLYLDEIQYFNKKQQQSLLEFIEDGRITLICSTTENPYFYIYNALLSRSNVFEFKPIKPEEMKTALERGLDLLNRENDNNVCADDGVLTYIAMNAAGDVRHAMNILESAYYIVYDSPDKIITAETVKEFVPNALGNFDKDQNVHYDLLSCLQKSIRGSDPDAAIFYLAKILEGGDIISACRRLQVIASEDIGNAYPLACVIVRSCVESAMNLGMPEAAIPLANATTLLANSPKSNSAYLAYHLALEDVKSGKGQQIPDHLRQSKNFKGYKYPHDYPFHYVKQQYLPDDVKDRKYFSFGENKTEQLSKEYWKNIKK